MCFDDNTKEAVTKSTIDHYVYHVGREIKPILVCNRDLENTQTDLLIALGITQEGNMKWPRYYMSRCYKTTIVGYQSDGKLSRSIPYQTMRDAACHMTHSKPPILV